MFVVKENSFYMLIACMHSFNSLLLTGGNLNKQECGKERFIISLDEKKVTELATMFGNW